MLLGNLSITSTNLLTSVLQYSHCSEPSRPPGSLWTSSRFGLALVAMLGFLNLYAQRVNLSVAVVCMLNHTASEMQEQLDAGLPFNRSLITANKKVGLSFLKSFMKVLFGFIKQIADSIENKQ